MKTIAVAVFSGFLLACTGGEADRPTSGDSGEDSPPAERASATADGPSVDPADITPADTAPFMVERPDDTTGGDWTAGRRDGGDTDTHSTLLTVRTAAHDGYDRVVFEFDGAVPGYSVEYVDSPQHQCGSGHEVRVPGDAWLAISFTSAAAHDEQGRATVENRRVDPAPPNLRELRMICDFEGHVDWVLGVGSPNPFRTLVLSDPGRLVLDVRN